MRKFLRIAPAEEDKKRILRRLLRLALVQIFGYVDEDNEQVPFTENLVWDIVQIASKGIVWDGLYLDKCDQEDPQFQALLSTILKLDLFQDIVFDEFDEFDDERGILTEGTARNFRDAMKNSTTSGGRW
jgi:hypothetical protein